MKDIGQRKYESLLGYFIKSRKSNFEGTNFYSLLKVQNGNSKFMAILF